jgi:hypothetical protein
MASRLATDHLCAFVRHWLLFGGASEEANAEMPQLPAVCAGYADGAEKRKSAQARLAMINPSVPAAMQPTGRDMRTKYRKTVWADSMPTSSIVTCMNGFRGSRLCTDDLPLPIRSSLH